MSYRSPTPWLRWLLLLAALGTVMEVAALWLADAVPALRLLPYVAAPVTIAQTVLGLLWFHRVSANIDGWVAARRWRRHWSWAAFLIPIANWVLPYFPVREVWRQSRPGDGTAGALPEASDRLLLVWWLLWACSSALGTLFSVGASIEGVGDGAVWLWVGRVGAVLLLGALYFFARVATTLAAWQDARAAHEGAAPVESHPDGPAAFDLK